MSGQLKRDDNGHVVQSFAPDATKSQVNASMTGTVTFRKGSGGTVDISGWTALSICPTADSTYYFNSNTTALHPLPSGVETNIMVIGDTITQVVVQFGTAITGNSVQGM